MRRRIGSAPNPSEVTPEAVYRARRELLKTAALLLPAWVAGCGHDAADSNSAGAVATGAAPAATPAESLTSFKDCTTYNNYYEFGTGKDEPAVNAVSFQPRPWTVTVAGHAEATGTYALDDLLKPHAMEDRVYRLRCVEGWSMVIPWRGFPLAELIKRCKPTSAAKYVAFTTLNAPERMPGQGYPVLDWPYTEGLRMDEAMHPLTMLATGLYGKDLPNQNGAPLRLVVPWKYGFKGIKAIVRIEFTETQPRTAWNDAAADEYGFYANVNPDHSHPRWSQKSERRIAEGVSVFDARIPTLPFNGYAEQVASLYAGMDLHRYF